MNEFKRLGYPIGIIFVSAFVIKMIDLYLVFPYVSMLVTILTVIALALFGMSLNKSRKRRNPSAFKKVLAVLIVIFLLLMQLGYFQLPFVSKTFNFFGVDAFFINMLYIFCGYLFVD
ncbi:MAG: amino acid permease [Erysipelotrichaceae bacterium]